jgi:hypothetical protein
VASDLIAAASAVAEAAADGEITPGEAASLSQLAANTAKAVKTFELAERLSATIGPSSGECRLKRRVAHPGIADDSSGRGTPQLEMQP